MLTPHTGRSSLIYLCLKLFHASYTASWSKRRNFAIIGERITFYKELSLSDTMIPVLLQQTVHQCGHLWPSWEPLCSSYPAVLVVWRTNPSQGYAGALQWVPRPQTLWWVWEKHTSRRTGGTFGKNCKRWFARPEGMCPRRGVLIGRWSHPAHF